MGAELPFKPELKEINWHVPESVANQIRALQEMCDKSNGTVSLDDVSKLLDRDKQSILASMSGNNCPFGFVAQTSKRTPIIPTAKLWLWFMGELVRDA